MTKDNNWIWVHSYLSNTCSLMIVSQSARGCPNMTYIRAFAVLLNVTTVLSADSCIFAVAIDATMNDGSGTVVVVAAGVAGVAGEDDDATVVVAAGGGGGGDAAGSSVVAVCGGGGSGNDHVICVAA